MRSPLTVYWFASSSPEDAVLSAVATRFSCPVHRVVVQDHLAPATTAARLRRLGELHAAALVVVVDDLETLARQTIRDLQSLGTLSGQTHVTDLEGRWRRVTVGDVLLHGLPTLARSATESALVLRLMRRRASRLVGVPRRRVEAQPHRGPDVAYLRTDMRFRLRAGGSVGHIRGVVEGLQRAGHPVHVHSSAPLPLDSRHCTECAVHPPPRSFHEIPDALAIRYGAWLAERLYGPLRQLQPSFLYQRYSLGNATGVLLSRRLGVPLVLEYNGSEVWVSRNWIRHLRHEQLATEIEVVNLRHAHLISVVSQVLQEELIDRGVEPERIVIHPNGITPEQFDPENLADLAATLRDELGIPRGATVAGFIGTFSYWHGIEVLAEAIPAMLQRQPALRFLLIGDGPLAPKLHSRLRGEIARGSVVMTGLVDQAKAPIHLMACDICLSPHVENPDGSRFFGSPTKLFEYMALGKGIVASDLEQIGEVLIHEESALLTPPGDATAFTEGVLRLVGDPALRHRLGARAREEVLARYTWDDNVRAVRRAMVALDLIPSDPIRCTATVRAARESRSSRDGGGSRGGHPPR